MTNARIERLTREALGPQRNRAYTKLDDAVLRAVAIAVLIITVVAIAVWPGDDSSAQRQRSAQSHQAI